MPRLPLGALFVACVVARVDEADAAELFRAGMAAEPLPAPARRAPRGARHDGGRGRRARRRRR